MRTLGLLANTWTTPLVITWSTVVPGACEGTLVTICNFARPACEINKTFIKVNVFEKKKSGKNLAGPDLIKKAGSPDRTRPDLRSGRFLVDAQFLKISDDKKTCNVRVVMSNTWIVRSLLRDARLLKTEGVGHAGKFKLRRIFSFKKTYVTKDRTLSEVSN